MLSIMVQTVERFLRVSMSPHSLAGVRIQAEHREVAAGNVEPDAMSLAEQVGRRPQIDGDLVDSARLH